jgi:hypothetical protein
VSASPSSVPECRHDAGDSHDDKECPEQNAPMQKHEGCPEETTEDQDEWHSFTRGAMLGQWEKNHVLHHPFFISVDTNVRRERTALSPVRLHGFVGFLCVTAPRL